MHYELDVQVVYEATLRVEARNIAEAELRARELVRPQGVFNDGLMHDGEDYEMDPHPVLHVLHHKEIEGEEEGERQ